MLNATEAIKLFREGKPERAKQVALKVLRKNSKDPQALLVMGDYAYAQSRMDEAIDYYQKCLHEKPGNLAALQGLTNVFYSRGNCVEALKTLEQMFHQNPRNANIFFQVAQCHYALRNYKESEHAFKLALSIDPNISQAYVFLAQLYRERNEPIEKTITLCNKAISIDHNNIDAHNALANCYLSAGDTTMACKAYQNFLDILAISGPAKAHIFSNYLFALHYPAEISREEIYQNHLRWLKTYKTEEPRPKLDFPNSPIIDRKLRVGFVSADFCEHSVFFFVHSLFADYDKQKFSFICFSERSPVKEDQYSNILKSQIDEWHPTANTNYRDFERLVDQTKIDILIDLSGHTGENRLINFMRRCAPIQVTWLGYPNTTGLDTMDYRIVDEITDPEPWADKLVTEELYRLPAPFLCFKPPEDWDSLPQREELFPGKIVFGSFNIASKLNESTISLWCEILRQIPEAELVIKSRFFGKNARLPLIDKKIKEYGINPNRLKMIDYLKSSKEHMMSYNEMDVALDPDPYNGTTTSLQSMWMGVPFITLAGDRHCARVGMSLLKAVELEEFITYSKEEYINQAVEISKNREKLSEIKQCLRERMRSSPLCDSEKFTKKFEAALAYMWEKWCNAKTTNSMD